MDIAQLGLSVDSSPVKKAAGDLDKLSKSAGKTERAAKDLEGQTERMSAAQYRASLAAKATTAAENTHTAALKTNTTAVQMNEAAMKRSNFRLQQGSYQLNDVVSGLAMGQEPFRIFTQQSGQIVQIWSGQGGVAAALSDGKRAIGALITRVGPLGLALTVAGGAAIAMGVLMNRSAEDVENLEDSISDLESAIDAASEATENAKLPYSEMREEYGGSEAKVKSMTAALVLLREEQKQQALQATLTSLANEDAFQKIEKALDTEGSYFGVGDFSAMAKLNAEMGITRDQAIEIRERLDDLGDSTGDEQAADKAAELRGWLDEAGIKSSELNQKLLDFEKAARKSFAAASGGAKDFEQRAKDAASALNDINKINVSARKGAAQASGDEMELIRLELEERRKALFSAANDAIENGASRIQVGISTAAALININARAQEEMTKAREDAAKKSSKVSDKIAKDKQSSLDALLKKEQSITDARLSGDGLEIKRIEWKLEQELSALDKIAAEAIKNGADAIKIEQRVAAAKAEARIAANQKIDEEEAKRAKKSSDKKEKDRLIKTYADYSREIEQATTLLGFELETRNSIGRTLAIENELLRSKIKLSYDEKLALADKIYLLNQTQRIEQSEADIKRNLVTYNRDLYYEMQALNNVYDEGSISLQQYANSLEDIGLRAIEARINAGEGGFADGFLAELGRMSQGAENFRANAGASFGQFFDGLSSGAADSFGRAIAYGENLGDSLRDVARDAVGQLISSLAQMGIQFLINAAIGQSLAAAATAASAAEAGLIAAAWAPAAAFASLATLGTNAIPAAAAVTGTVALSEGLAIASRVAGGREHGGPVSAAEMYEVGEKNRPEILAMNGKSYMIPGNRGQVYNERQMTPVNDSRGSGSGDRTINVYYSSVNNFSGVTRDEVMKDVEESQKRQREEIKQSLPSEIQQFEFDRGRGAA